MQKDWEGKGLTRETRDEKKLGGGETREEKRLGGGLTRETRDEKRLGGEWADKGNKE